MTIFFILTTRFIMVFLHGEKSNYSALLQQAIAQAGKAPKILLTDQALEYNSKGVDAIYKKHNIFKQTTNANCQHSNSLSEN